MSIFRIEGERFVPTRHAESPWSPAGLHGGPAAGLLARAIERTAAAEDLIVTRLTIDLFRQVPNAPLEVATRVIRQGRRIQATEASIWHDGVEISRATGLLLQQTELNLPDDAFPRQEPPRFPDAEKEVALTGQEPGASNDFHQLVHTRRVTTPAESFMPTTAWMKIPGDFIEGEPTSPLVRVAALSDFTNALAHFRAKGEVVGFINADITLYLHRHPAGEWICLEVEGNAQPNGIATARATLYDREGSIGMVNVARLANKRAPGMPSPLPPESQ